MSNRNPGKLARSSNLARTGMAAVRTVAKLSRLSSSFEPLESRMMMSVAHPPVHLAPHPTKAAVKSTPTLAVPSAVTIVSTSPTSVKIGWTEGTSTATGYKVLRATGSGSFVQLTPTITTASALSFTDTAVTTNTAYSYRVEAFNKNATSAASTAVTTRTPLVAPSGLTAAALSGTSIKLAWTDNASAATSYEVYRSTDGTHFSPYANVSGASITTYTDTSAASGKSFKYELQACSSTNTSAITAAASAITPLAAPSGLSATVNSSSQIHLSWTDNDSSATGYLVLRSTDGVHFTTLSTLTAGAVSMDDKTVLPFTTYYFQVQATTSVAKSVVSSTANGATPLATPGNLLIPSLGPTSVSITWTDTDAAAKGYIVLRSTDATNYTQVGTITTGSTHTFTDNTAVNDTTYNYEVKAVNGNTTSAPGISSAVTTLLSSVTGVTGTATSTSVSLSWTNNDNLSTGYTILRARGASQFQVVANVSGGSTTTYTDNAVISGQQYCYSVIATGANNRASAMSTIGNVTTPLNAPSDLHVSPTSGTSIVLTWTDHDTNATGYNILRSTDGTNFTSIAKPTGATLATYNDSNVSSIHTYYYQVIATNSASASAAVTSSSITTPLNAPVTLTAAMAGSNVNLSWVDKDTNATGYTILRSTDGISFTQLDSVTGAAAHNYADTTATAGQKYYYQVQATATNFTSLVSNTASVTATTPNSTSTVTITTRNTNELVITSTGTDDSITVTQSGSTLTITANGTTTTQPAPTAGLFIYTRGGADSVTVDQTVTAATTVETIDLGVDDLTINATNATIWDDSGDIYTGTGTVHTVAAFAGGVAKTTGASLADPKDSGTIMHVTGSLFGTGPVAADINQGAVGDCYFMSSLAAFAGFNPAVLQQSAVDMGDGTYTVQYINNSGAPSYIRENNDIPTRGGGSYTYARPGASGNLWAVIMEKAYAYFRTGANTYASISSGWMGSVYAALGVNSNFFIMSNMTSDTLASTLKTALAAGKEVTLGTGNSPPNLVGGHAYTLISATTDGNGNTTYVVRNPWGVQGDSLENSQGYATLTFAQMFANFYDGCVAI